MADSIWPQIYTRSLAKTKPKHRKVSFTGRLHLFAELKLFLPIHFTIILYLTLFCRYIVFVRSFLLSFEIQFIRRNFDFVLMMVVIKTKCVWTEH